MRETSHLVTHIRTLARSLGPSRTGIIFAARDDGGNISAAASDGGSYKAFLSCRCIR